ncbi:hypothetical protein AWE51_25605 [Aquimarina aggregata]|uniref:Uncharacterized protein n=1 Tax=Aquimarina aggregata TaxID=1642818 RepID=A0A162F9V2_9FLAO|nr:alpha/beta hydrolase-fold protein [Aquimarina aggregata]KZS40066.1 hypothetical protein AWE51_25605 [Aquimarina aggregata]
MIKLKQLFTLFLLLGFIACGKKEKLQKTEKTNSTKSNLGIQIGKFDSIKSDILNQERELIIYLPESFKNPNRKRNKYPVVYLLDGAYNFVPFIGMLKQYSEMNDTKILPEMIVVGIPNINFKSRMMDFSPTTDGNPEQFGGGNKFLEFIRKELFPHIEQSYSGSNKNRTIVGHSFGGLVVMNSLIQYPQMFDNYLLIDGSLDFDDQLFLKNSNYSLKEKKLEGKNLYIGIANTATYGSNLNSIKKDTIRANKFVRHSLELVNQIENLDTGINMEWKYYEDDTHGSTAYLAQKDGFRFFYSWFEFKEEHKYRSKYFIPKTIGDRFANLTKVHFDSISKRLDYNFYPDKEWLSSNANMLLNWHQQPNQAKEVFELNKEYYPKTPSVYNDLGDFYLSQKDTAKAIENYKKSLNFEHNPSIKDILNEIE